MTLSAEDALDSFARNVQDMIFNYLITYCVGKIQFKFSWNAANHWRMEQKLSHYLKGLNNLFNVDMKTGGSLKHLSDEQFHNLYFVQKHKLEIFYQALS